MNINFPCSHDVLVDNWKIEDYELAVVNGTCDYCFREVAVLTQSGAARFGLNAGFCLFCISVMMPEEPSLELSVGFSDSQDVHVIRVDSEKIQNFLNNESLLTGFSAEQLANLREAVEKNKNNPLLAQSREYKKKPHQCKDCFGYILDTLTSRKLFDEYRLMRKDGKPCVSCMGCGSFIERQSGCSVVTCMQKICGIQACVFCLNGASEEKNLTHSVKECSQSIYSKVALPQPRECECQSIEKKS